MKTLLLILGILLSVTFSTHSATLFDFYKAYAAATGLPDKFGPLELGKLLKFTSSITGPGLAGITDPSARDVARFTLITQNYEKAKSVPVIEDFDPWTKEILTAIQEDFSGKSDRLEALLGSSDPAIRWVGVTKFKGLELTETVRKRLNEIIKLDPYIIIANKPVGDNSRSTDNYIEVFKAPIRDHASALLNVAVDENQVAADGISKFFEVAKRSPEQAANIRQVLLQIHAGTPAVQDAHAKIRAGEILK